MAKKFIALLCCFALLATFVGCVSGTPTPQPTEPPATEAAGNPEPTQETNEAPVDNQEDNVIYIGLILPFSGGSATQAAYQKAGIEAYLKFCHPDGIASLGGARIEFVEADTESTSDIGVSAMDRLCSDERISAIIGGYNSGVAAAMAPLATKYQVPYLLTNAVGHYINNVDSNYVFRANPDDISPVEDYMGFWAFLNEKYGISKIFIINDSTELGTTNAENSKKQIEYLQNQGVDISIVGTEFIQAGASDFSSIINKVKASGADIIFPSVAAADAILLYQQILEYGLDLPVYANGNGFVDPTFLANFGEDANYIMSNAYFFAAAADNSFDPVKAHEVLDWCEQTMGGVANEPFGMGFLGMGVLVDAIERAGSTDREAIAKALDETDIKAGHDSLLLLNYDGVRFEDFEVDFYKEEGMQYNQNRQFYVMFAQYIDGDWKVIYPEEKAGEVNPLFLPQYDG